VRQTVPAGVVVLDIAAQLAHEDAAAQAEFLSVFCGELRKVCGTHYHTEFQLVSAWELLDQGTRDTLHSLVPNRNER
jgi:hypothetical protein